MRGALCAAILALSVAAPVAAQDRLSYVETLALGERSVQYISRPNGEAVLRVDGRAIISSNRYRESPSFYGLYAVFELPDRWLVLLGYSTGGMVCDSSYRIASIFKTRPTVAVTPMFAKCVPSAYAAQVGDRVQIGFSNGFMRAEVYEYRKARMVRIEPSAYFPKSAFSIVDNRELESRRTITRERIEFPGRP